MGPAFRGGHGRLEGEHGLVADGIVHFNVVLADGSQIGVNATSHSDLFWALRGAGDKLEQVFKQLNILHTRDYGTTLVLMSYAGGSFAMDPRISTTEAVLSWTFASHGPAKNAEALLAPFNAIGAAYEEVGDVSYPELAVVETQEGGPQCQDGPFVVSTNLLLTYNAVTAEWQSTDSLQQRKHTATLLQNASDLLATVAKSSGTYANEASPWVRDWTREYWHDNYPKLLSIKRTYDPKLLHCWHCVGWEASLPGFECTANLTP